MVTAHGKTKAYLHRFKIMQSPECVCTHGDQTADRLIFDCEIIDKERDKLIAYTSKEDDWPVRKCELVNRYLKQFTMFANSIDFEKNVVSKEGRQKPKLPRTEKHHNN